MMAMSVSICSAENALVLAISLVYDDDVHIFYKANDNLIHIKIIILF